MAAFLTPRDWVVGHPDTPEALLGVGARRAAKRGRAVKEHGRALVARVQRGAWIADCPVCGAGIALDPEWPLTQCLGEGCYTVFRSIVVPASWRQIEAVLEGRHRLNQNWLPHESVEDLKAENVRHAKELP